MLVIVIPKFAQSGQLWSTLALLSCYIFLRSPNLLRRTSSEDVVLYYLLFLSGTCSVIAHIPFYSKEMCGPARSAPLNPISTALNGFENKQHSGKDSGFLDWCPWHFSRAPQQEPMLSSVDRPHRLWRSHIEARLNESISQPAGTRQSWLRWIRRFTFGRQVLHNVFGWHSTRLVEMNLWMWCEKVEVFWRYRVIVPSQKVKILNPLLVFHA